jgi:hypothetical protein
VLTLREVLSSPHAAAVATEGWVVRLGPRKQLSDVDRGASAIYDEMARSQPPSDGELNHAVLLGLSGRLDEAVAVFDRYLALVDLSVVPEWASENWVGGRQRAYERMRRLRAASDEPASFYDEIRARIAAGRIQRGLEPDVALPF